MTAREACEEARRAQLAFDRRNPVQLDVLADTTGDNTCRRCGRNCVGERCVLCEAKS